MAVAIKFWVKVTAVTGSPLIRCHYTTGTDNWGASLVAADADFESTKEYEAAADVEVTSTGWISFDLDVANMDVNGTLYVRLQDMNYGAQSTESITFASANNATAGDRPYLEITVTSDAQYVHTWTCVC